jgi:molybdopterin converting factor small subunit
VEDAVAAVGALGQGLGVVLEGVRWRLGALVADLQERRCGLGEWLSNSFMTKSTWGPLCSMEPGDEALDAQLGVVGLVAHAAELGDGDVVALVGAVAGPGQPDDGADDNGSRNPDPTSNDTRVRGRGQPP